MATSTQMQGRGGLEGSRPDNRGGLDEMARRKGIDKPTYTQTPNILFDELMRDMSEAELKVTLAIMRQTFGWHRQFYEMSLTDLQELTGLSRPSITKGIDAGIRRATIRRRQDEEGNFYYGLIVNDADDDEDKDYPLTKKPKSPSKKSLPVASKNSLPVGSPLGAEGSKEFLPGTSKESLPVEPVTSKNSLPKVVKNFYQYTPALKKVKESTTKEREKERSSSSSDRVLPARKDDDDDLAFNSVVLAWNEGMPAKASKHIQQKLKELIAECGPDTVIAGILAAVEAGGRSFKYVATCTRNLREPTLRGKSDAGAKGGYRLDEVDPYAGWTEADFQAEIDRRDAEAAAERAAKLAKEAQP